MTRKEKNPDDAGPGPAGSPAGTSGPSLRQRAEAAFRETGPLAPEATRSLLHELQVHQIELEMQNEELRRSQNELEASRASYQNLYEFSPAGHCTLSEQGLILQANLTFASLLGVPRGKLHQQLFFRFILKEDQDAFYLLRKQLVAIGEPQGRDLRLVRPDGSFLWAHATATIAHDQTGTPVHRIELVDISERKRLEEQLLKQAVILGKMVANIGDVIVIIDAEGINRYKSPNLEATFGWKPEELVGAKALENLHPDDQDAARQFLGEILAGSKAKIGFECRYRCKNGQYRWIHFTGVNLLSDPDIRGLLGNYHDITERRRLEEESRVYQRQVLEAQKHESLSVLAGGIAHDFNNILAGVLGQAELVIRDLPADSPAQEHLKYVREGALRAADLSGQMLAYSGRGHFFIQPESLNQAVEKVVNLLRLTVRKSIGFVVQLDPTQPLILADAAQLRHVITSLLVNAAEAIGEGGGTITVRTGRAQPEAAASGTTVLLPAPSAGSTAFLEVADTGCGMDAATQAKIFEPFFSTKFTGRGLGLAAVLGIMRGHNGAIKIRSVPGQGATFQLFFPCAAESEAAPVAAATAATPAAAPGCVLIVDDDEAIRITVGDMLELEGFEVVRASDGREAVAIFQAEPERFRLVLMDLTMPHLDGVQACMAMRCIRANVRVVLMSGFDRQEAIGRFKGAAPAGYLQKPFAYAELFKVLHAALAAG